MVAALCLLMYKMSAWVTSLQSPVFPWQQGQHPHHIHYFLDCWAAETYSVVKMFVHGHNTREHLCVATCKMQLWPQLFWKVVSFCLSGHINVFTGATFDWFPSEVCSFSFLNMFNSIQFYLFSTNSQQKSFQDMWLFYQLYICLCHHCCLYIYGLWYILVRLWCCSNRVQDSTVCW